MTPEEIGWTPEKIERYNRDVMDQALAEIERLKAELVTERERTAGELKELVTAYGEINRLRDVNRRNVVEMERLAGELNTERARLDYMIDESNKGNGWLQDHVWDDAAQLSVNREDGENVRNWVRAAIDDAMAQEAKEARDGE